MIKKNKKPISINDAIQKEISDCIKRIACLTVGEGEYEVINYLYVPAINNEHAFYLIVKELQEKK